MYCLSGSLILKKYSSIWGLVFLIYTQINYPFIRLTLTLISSKTRFSFKIFSIFWDFASYVLPWFFIILYFSILFCCLISAGRLNSSILLVVIETLTIGFCLGSYSFRILLIYSFNFPFKDYSFLTIKSLITETSFLLILTRSFNLK